MENQPNMVISDSHPKRNTGNLMVKKIRFLPAVEMTGKGNVISTGGRDLLGEISRFTRNDNMKGKSPSLRRIEIARSHPFG